MPGHKTVLLPPHISMVQSETNITSRLCAGSCQSVGQSASQAANVDTNALVEVIKVNFTNLHILPGLNTEIKLIRSQFPQNQPRRKLSQSFFLYIVFGFEYKNVKS